MKMRSIIAIIFVMPILALLFFKLFVMLYVASYEKNLWRVHPDEIEARDRIASVNGFFSSRYEPERHIFIVCFRDCDITDDDLICLKQLSHLRNLELTNVDITDEAIPTIISISSLRFLDIKKTKITQEGVQQIMKERPDLSIEIDISPTP